MDISAEEMAFLQEADRVFYKADGESRWVSLPQPVQPPLLAELTAWLRTLPTGLDEAEFDRRARERFATEWQQGESEPPAT